MAPQPAALFDVLVMATYYVWQRISYGNILVMAQPAALFDLTYAARQKFVGEHPYPSGLGILVICN